jgi:uncharacterized protein YjlB
MLMTAFIRVWLLAMATTTTLAVDLDGRHDPAAVIEDLFEANGWGDTWRDGIYDYVHYHSRIHEVLGISRGTGRVRFGGRKGRIFTLKAGDVAILPAGTGHQRLSASDDFLVIGARAMARCPEGHHAAAKNRRTLKQSIRLFVIPMRQLGMGTAKCVKSA